MSDDRITINLQGDRDVVAAFRDLREYLPNTAVRTATRQAALELAQLVALLAPKLTGRLARNIVVRVRRTAKTIRARVTVNTEGKRGDDQNAFYWRFMEEGFRTRAGEFKKFPFVINAFNAMKERSAQKVVDGVEKSIARAERKAKRASL